MEKGESALYFLFMVGCTMFAVSALKHLSLGTAAAPGPGYVPLLVSVIAFVLSAVLFVQSLKKVIADRTMSISDWFLGLCRDKEVQSKVARVAIFIAATIVYLMLFKKANFYLITFVYISVLGKLFGMKGWLRPPLLGAGFVIVVYLVFVVAFDMHI